MRSRRENFWRIAVVLGIVAAFGLEGYLLLSGRQRAEKARAMLEAKENERENLRRHAAALSDGSAEAMVRSLTRARAVLVEYAAALKGTEPARLAAPVPAKPIDAFFDLLTFRRRGRGLAAQVRMQLQPNESFGFASYLQAGPETDLMAAVFRQRVVVEHLLEILARAGPVALVSVERERPVGEATRRVSGRVVRGGVAAPAPPAGAARDVLADFFVPDDSLLLRPPGAAGGGAFRVEFTGDTSTLRDVIGRLAEFRLPLVVRSVEVQPAVPAVRARSRFAVVVELIGSAEDNGGPAT